MGVQSLRPMKTNEIKTLRQVCMVMTQQREHADIERLAEIKAQWNEFEEIRDKDLLLRLCFSSQEFFDACLAEHPAKKLWDNVQNVRRAFDILRSSRLDLIDLAGQFHARISQNLLDKEGRAAALSKATKEIYTYSCAALSLVQAYRHFVSASPRIAASYDELKSEVLSGKGVILFFSELRRANNHLHILAASPHYTISNDLRTGNRQVTSGITFSRELILSNSEWNEAAKSFVAARDNLDVISLMEEHFDLASKFNELFLIRTGVHSDKGYRDIERILSARKTMSYRTSLGVMLQIAIPKKLNPYEYLHRWFSESELEMIYSFPDHTKEQLEYMIALRDPFQFCDKHTRRELYKLFSIPLDLLPEQPEENPRTDF
jgi:hypothetical protein